MSRRVLYVVPLKDPWAIKNAVTGKLLSNFPTKSEAIDAARKISNGDPRGLVVYGRQGQPFLKVPLKVTQSSRLSESKVRAAVRAVAKERQETYKTS